MSIPVITISREYGSGGRIIGMKLAETLGIPFYDKELIMMAAKESGLSEEFVRRAEQMKTISFLYSLYMNTQTMPLTDQIFVTQSKIIRTLAEKGPCVIVGRCGDYVLRNRENCLHTFIHAPLDQRTRRVQEDYKVTESNIADHVRKVDRQRSAYYNYFAQHKWGDSRHYHLSISSSMGLDTVVELLKYAAQNFTGGVLE